jgi:Flp pilus assembly protein CpaB
MRRGRILIFLAVILLIGLIVAAVALPRILPMFQPTPTATVYQVYYALQNISQGTLITEELLGIYNLPETSFADVMFTVQEKSSLVGQKAKIAIDQGVPFTTGMVASPDTGLEAGGPPWASIIAASKNAITVPISRLAAVGFGVADGAHVNVIACMLMVDVDPSYQAVLPNHVAVAAAPANVPPDGMPGISLNVVPKPSDLPYQGRTEVESAFQQPIYIIPSEPQRPRPVCQMVMQDVTVLRLGNFELNPATTATNQATPTPQAPQQAAANPVTPDIVTLIVSPQEAVILTYMVYTNTPIYLTLRNSGDTSRQVTESATLQFLLSQLNITVPVKLAYSVTPRVDTLALPFLPNDVVTVSP